MSENQTYDTSADDREIRRLFDQLLDAWTRSDARAYGRTFTPDVDYVPYDGSRVGQAPVAADGGRGPHRRRLAVHRLPQCPGPPGAGPRADVLPGTGVPRDGRLARLIGAGRRGGDAAPQGA